MSASRLIFRTVQSVNLVFGLEWFAILGGSVSREVRRIARQQKATHAVHAGDIAMSVGLASLPVNRRSTAQYSAAQLVAQHFSAGAIALIVQLDAQQWWFVAAHDGAVIARTDLVCQTFEEAAERLAQLRNAYPGLTFLNDDKQQPSLSDLVATLRNEALLQRVAKAHYLISRPYYSLATLVVLAYLLFQSDVPGMVFSRNDSSAERPFDPDRAWEMALHTMTETRWVHGVSGSAGVLSALYDLPVRLSGWRLHSAECVALHDDWQCHADYGRDDPEASNELFLSAASTSWDVDFTPLELARARWRLAASGQNLTKTSLYSAQHVERSVFSALQSIRPAFALMSIDAPQLLPVRPPLDEDGQAISRPTGLPKYRSRVIRMQAPLRSMSLLLPHARSMAWQKVELSMDPRVRPDLTHSRLTLNLQGVLYEQD